MKKAKFYYKYQFIVTTIVWKLSINCLYVPIILHFLSLQTLNSEEICTVYKNPFISQHFCKIKSIIYLYLINVILLFCWLIEILKEHSVMVIYDFWFIYILSPLETMLTFSYDALKWDWRRLLRNKKSSKNLGSNCHSFYIDDISVIEHVHKFQITQ